MQVIDKYRSSFIRLSKGLVWLIVLLGITLRLVLYFQNRNLIIDEANIVRNLHERNFLGLVLPLKYEQFAPPMFLWIEELSSIVLGYSEKAMRFYPLVSGIISLFLFRSIMIRVVKNSSLWFPMALMAFTYLLIKYSAELKQYMPDGMITLLLIWFALRKEIFQMEKTRFILFWSIAGSLAVWSSMPSVFILAAIGCYYLWQVMQEKKWSLVGVLAIIALVWLCQFAIYYWFILKPQIESDYLQGYHFDYFLYATPDNREEWMHNYYRLKEIINNVGGYNEYSFYLSCIFIVVGIVTMIRRNPGLFILSGLPIILTLVAAALNQYTLIDRVILFMMPLWLILFGYGFGRLWKLKFIPLRLGLTFIGVFMVWNYNMFWLFERKLAFHEITEGLDYLKLKGAKGDQVYIHDASVPTFIYYTVLHPDHKKYSQLANAHKLSWETDYSELTKNINEPVCFLYTGGFPDSESEKRVAQIEKNMQQADYFRKDECIVFVYTYVPKPGIVDTSIAN